MDGHDPHQEEAERLLHWMRTHGFTLADFAEEIGMKENTVYKALVERGRVSGSIKYKFAVHFGTLTARSVFDPEAEAV